MFAIFLLYPIWKYICPSPTNPMPGRRRRGHGAGGCVEFGVCGDYGGCEECGKGSGEGLGMLRVGSCVYHCVCVCVFVCVCESMCAMM